MIALPCFVERGDTLMDRFAFRVFPAAEAVLYVSFLILDLSGHMTASIPLKYAGIILCLFAAIPSARTADGCVTSLALAFTAAADWFLLLQNRHYMVGISLFCIVQLLYFIRLLMWRGRICIPTFVLRLVPLLLLFSLKSKMEALALFYFSGLVCNALDAVLFSHEKQQKQKVFAAGLSLFVFCDICVGAYNLGLLTGFTRYGMWLFYLPAQVLIARSTHLKGNCP